MTWAIQSGLGLFMGSWNFVTSSESSTTEGASDFSLSHLSWHLPLVFCCVFVVVCWVGFCSVFFLRVLQVLGAVLIFTREFLDDRQCFIARSAMRKKKIPCRQILALPFSILGR